MVVVVVVRVAEEEWVVVFSLAVVTGVAALGGAGTPAGLVVAWQLAITLWTGGVPGGSKSIGGVPGGALTVKVSVVPSRKVAVTVHGSAEAIETARTPITTRARPTKARKSFTVWLIDTT